MYANLLDSLLYSRKHNFVNLLFAIKRNRSDNRFLHLEIADDESVCFKDKRDTVFFGL